ncbi:MAG: fumarate hydratase [Thermodesulfobacteriota bacterium]|nr:fumarate hydratase [Thermodesulfobacteriota bacterium]
MSIKQDIIEEAGYYLHWRAATKMPEDAKKSLRDIFQRETKKLPKYVLGKIIENFEKAESQKLSICSDPGIPRFYVKVGNKASIRGGFVALEEALRRATARATKDIPLRSNAVHPLTHENPATNLGIFAPDVFYSFEPMVDWIEITVSHKGGFYGSDYRWLLPGDGIDGMKRFFLDVISVNGHRGYACPPSLVGIGIGGNKDVSFRLGREAVSLRTVGDRHPDPYVADLEEELKELANSTMFGAMGLWGDVTVMDVHIEIAYGHTGGPPMSIHQHCNAVRRASARIYPTNKVEYKDSPDWFTPYYRRKTIAQEA